MTPFIKAKAYTGKKISMYKLKKRQDNCNY